VEIRTVWWRRWWFRWGVALAVCVGLTAAAGPVGPIALMGYLLFEVFRMDGRRIFASTKAVARSHPQTRLADAGIAPRVKVKTYASARDYERDAPRMASQGWQPQGQSQGGAHLNMGRTVGKSAVGLLVPGGVLWGIVRPSRTKDKITVTWVR
jgi:hypothetical protein